MQSNWTTNEIHQSTNKWKNHKRSQVHSKQYEKPHQTADLVSTQKGKKRNELFYQLNLQGAEHNKGMWQHALIQVDNTFNKFMENIYQP